MSKTHGNINSSDRAKQFAPFAALKGHEMELAKKRKHIDKKIILAEDEAEHINQVLSSLQKGDKVEVVYYAEDVYHRLSGIVEKIYIYEAKLQVSDRIIGFVDIYKIEKKGI